jgi:hypothetical protein
MVSDLVRSLATLEAEILDVAAEISVPQRTAPKEYSFCAFGIDGHAGEASTARTNQIIAPT